MRTNQSVQYQYAEIEAIEKKCLELVGTTKFTKFLVALQSYRQPSSARRCMITNYPTEWLDRYGQRDYISYDPVATRTLSSSVPVYWEELGHLSPLQRMVMKEAKAHGLNSGLTLSLRLSQVDVLVLSLAGEGEDLAPMDVRWQVIAAAHRFLCEHGEEIANVVCDNPLVRKPRRLTAPQRQVLSMIMRGMRIKEIARHLNIHVRAVEDRLARACQRLNASSRGQAIHRAIGSGQVDIISQDLHNIPPIEIYLHEAAN